MTEHRKHSRKKIHQTENLKITCHDRLGEARVVAARLVDVSDEGLGVETDSPLQVGSLVSVSSKLGNNDCRIPLQDRARVAFCQARQGGAFRVGIYFEDPGFRHPFLNDEREGWGARETAGADSFIDLYEVMQLSPSADIEMIHRVYRLLAQRHHPDNQDTGDEEAFKRLLKAHRVLSDPEQRAAYDIQHRARRRRQWKIFDQPKAAQGREAEKRKRRGILSLLYHKRMHEPDQPNMNIMDFEELLGCPREHLEFSLWYLKENSWIGRGDNGRYFITAKGVDAAEASMESGPLENRLLTVGEASSSSEEARLWNTLEQETLSTV